jgi:hypothetical protein
LDFDDLGASDGTYSLTVTADGGAGHLASAVADVVIDGTAPSPPVITDGSVNRKGRVNLSWTASDDGAGSGIDHYEVYRDGVKRGDASGTSYTDSGGVAGQIYEILAEDGVGWRSSMSDPFTLTGGGGGPGGGGGGGGPGGGGGGGDKCFKNKEPYC